MDILKEERERWIKLHVDYRLSAVDFLRWACQVAVRPSVDRPKAVALSFDGQEVISSNSTGFIAAPLIEIGAVYCSAILEFLGIRYDAGSMQMKQISDNQRNRNSDDVQIESFELPQLTVDQFLSFCEQVECPDHLVPVAQANAAKACAYTIFLANKTLAHLTSQGTYVDYDFPKLELCGTMVSWSLCRFLYEPMGIKPPSYINPLNAGTNEETARQANRP